LATDWNPNSNGIVYCISSKGANIYVGGAYTSIGGQNRNDLAAIDTNTGQANSWNPYSDGQIRSLQISGTKVYAAGAFSNIGGQPRDNVACIDSAGNATSWNPKLNGMPFIIYTLFAKGQYLYIGGDIRQIAPGQEWNNIVRVDTITGNLSSWNPNSSANVFSIFADDEFVCVGGAFGTIGGIQRQGIACVDTQTGSATSWNPNLGGASVISAYGKNLYVGGSFSGVTGDPSNFAIFYRDNTTISKTYPSTHSTHSGLIFHSFAGNPGILYYTLSQDVPVSIRLVDMHGRLIWSVKRTLQSAGSHKYLLSNTKIHAGLYLIQFRVGKFEESRSIIIAR
jgi:hypothetical protein